MEIRYPARIVPQEGGGFHVEFVDMPNVVTCGDTEEECLFNASEALTAMLEASISRDISIPPPSLDVEDACYIAPDAKAQAALLVRFARESRSISDLARSLGTSWPAAKRMENPQHWPSLKSLERTAAVLGKRLVLSFEKR